MPSMTDMEDLGQNRDKGLMVEAPAKNAKPEKTYPSVELNSDQIDGIDDYKVGDKCFLCFEGEVEKTESSDKWDHLPKGTMKVRFKLVKGTVMDSAPKVKSSDGKNGESAYHEAVEEGEDHRAMTRIKGKMKGY